MQSHMISVLASSYDIFVASRTFGTILWFCIFMYRNTFSNQKRFTTLIQIFFTYDYKLCSCPWLLTFRLTHIYNRFKGAEQCELRAHFIVVQILIL